MVTTLSTGSRDAVIPEVTGLLIPPGYPVAIQESVLKLLGNPERSRRMGQAARAWVLDHYINGQVLALAVRYYKNLLERNLPRRASGGRPATPDSLFHPV